MDEIIIKNTKQERNRIIDMLKGIAVILVIYGHLLEGRYCWPFIMLTEFHLPLFIFVSGLFFEHSYEKYKKGFIWQKVKGLLFPYIVWSAVAFAVNALLLWKAGQANEIGQEFLSIFLYARSVWFLIVCFLMEIMAYLCMLLAKNKMSLFMAFMLFVWGICLLVKPIALFSIYRGQWLLPYFLLGVLLSDQKRIFTGIHKLENWSLLKKIFAFFLTLFMFLFLTFAFMRPELFDSFYGKFEVVVPFTGYYFIFYVLGLAGILLSLFLSILLEKVKGVSSYLQACGKYSIDVYVIHMFFVKAYLMIMGSGRASHLQYALFFMISLVISLCIVLMARYILRKIKLYRLSVGGR